MTSEKKPSAYLVWEKSDWEKITVKREDDLIHISDSLACLYASSQQSITLRATDIPEILKMLEAALGADA